MNSRDLWEVYAEILSQLSWPKCRMLLNRFQLVFAQAEHNERMQERWRDYRRSFTAAAEAESRKQVYAMHAAEMRHNQGEDNATGD